MSVAFRAAALTGLLVVVVNPTLAQFKPSQSTYFTGGYVECGVVELRDSDKGKDPDPIYKIVVNLELDENKNPTSLFVNHVSVHGKNYDRSKQYTIEPQLWGTPGKMEWFWSGKRKAGSRTYFMKGALIKNTTGLHYYEELKVGNKTEMYMYSICHQEEVE
jgi:hypothetical protein